MAKKGQTVTIMRVSKVFFSHLKTEKLYLVRLKTIEHAYQVIQEYIHFYNQSRFQEKLNVLSPIGYREKVAEKYTLFHCLLDRVMCNGGSFLFYKTKKLAFKI
jgi:hypothetical protein